MHASTHKHKEINMQPDQPSDDQPQPMPQDGGSAVPPVTPPQGDGGQPDAVPPAPVPEDTPPVGDPGVVTPEQPDEGAGGPAVGGEV